MKQLTHTAMGSPWQSVHWRPSGAAARATAPETRGAATAVRPGGAAAGTPGGGGGSLVCEGVDVEAISAATELSLELRETRELPSGSIECTLWAAGEGSVNVVVGSDAANGMTGEPVSGVGDEAMSDGRDMYARAEDTEVWVRLQYGGLAGGSDDVAPDIAQGRLTEATRIVLAQATA